jgi:hypothetical protein
MPAYSTWQPTEGKIQPVASAVQSATRRLVDPRGDLMRGNPIASTLLGVFGGPSDPFREGGNTAVGSPFLVPPTRPRRPWPVSGLPATETGQLLHCLVPVLPDSPDGPWGAVVGLFTWLWNRPDRPF